MTPVLVLEINEVPWRLVDRYAAHPRLGNLRRFFERASTYTSVAVDAGELSPWITWPTMHRGMDGARHGIEHLGQDPATYRGTPIWEAVRRDGGSVGVCGAMQSWPPVDPGPRGFFVPDTFARDERCYPPYLEPLQRMNLAQVRLNPRVVSSRLPQVRDALALLRGARRSGLRLRTFAAIAAQLAAERLDARRIAWRPDFQAVLFWDVFRHHFDARDPPAYASFFTNHVAGAMHRYWKDVFPGDFGEPAPAADRTQEPLMLHALSIVDSMLGDAMGWAERNPSLAVVFAASMGQQAVHRDGHPGRELVVTRVQALLEACGLPRERFRPLLAMVPQAAAEVPEAGDRAALLAFLGAIRTAAGAAAFEPVASGESVSITLRNPPLADIEAGYFTVNGARLPFADLGIEARAVDAGTGYHMPEGAFAVLLPAGTAARDPPRAAFRADRYKGWLLALLRTGAHDSRGLLDPEPPVP
jgi:hypothetical protein